MTTANVNTQLKMRGAPMASGFSNASGPHPGEFNLAKYNAIINMVYPDENAQSTIDNINAAILPEVRAYQIEYNRQAGYFNSQGDNANKQVVERYRTTAEDVITELGWKIDTLKKQVQYYNSPRNPRRLLEAGTATLDNTATARLDKDGNLIDANGNILYTSHEPGKGPDGSSFLKNADGSFKYMNIGIVVLTVGAVGTGIYYFFIKK